MPPTDLEIARSVTPRPIVDVAEELGLRREDLHLFGDIVAKVKTSVPAELPGRLILVSAMTPTKAG